MKRETVILSLLLCICASCAINNQAASGDPSSAQKDNQKNISPGKDITGIGSDALAVPDEKGQAPSDAFLVSDNDEDVEKGGARKYLPASYRSRNYEWGTEKFSAEKLATKALEIRKYAEQNSYNTSVVFLVDMQVKSGKKRFFVYDLDQMKILRSGLVAHGSGGKSFSYDKTFSNTPGSGCTSLGIYKIGNSYNGRFGLAFRLYGLEQTNNNAFKRLVVLHAMDCIPDEDINGILCQTEGCPAVAPAFLAYLASTLKQAEKPVLMWIFR